MPTYTYRARTMEGEERRGTRDAEDLPALGRSLREEGFLLVDAKTEGEAGRRRDRAIPFLSRVPLSERMMATRHLAVLIEAGVDLPRALSTLGRQTRNAHFRQILTRLAEEIRRGRKLSEAFAAHPKIFSEVYIAMIAAGEESGRLVESLNILAKQLENQHKLRSRVRGAMMYPAIIIVAMIGIGIAMFVFVVPQLEDVFGDLTAELPPQTRFIFWLSHALLAQWYFFFLGALAALALLRMAWASSRGRRVRDALLMRAPVFRRLLREIASAQVARTLSSLVSSGVPIVRAIEITSGVTSNEYFRRSLLDAARKVERGRSIHEVLAEHPWVYPPLVIEMAEVGEESGKFSEVFADLATFYEGEVDQRTQTLSSIIEPMLMVIIGAVVGFFAVSLMGPMYNMIGTL